MYYYIFEQSRDQKETERVTAIREHVSQLGIAGEMATLRSLDQAEDIVLQAVSKRYSTIVAVGGLETINAVARAISEHDVVLGIIPLFQHPDIAHLIGISDWKEAAEHLKRRRWHPVGLGIMNGTDYFLTPVSCSFTPSDNLTVITDDYEAMADRGTLTVRLPGCDSDEGLIVQIESQYSSKPLLSRIIRGSKAPAATNSIFRVPSLRIETSQPVAIQVAGSDILTTPVAISTHTTPIKLIVAKHVSPA